MSACALPRALPQKRVDRNDVVASHKKPTEGEVGEVQRASGYDLVRALAPRHAYVGKCEKCEVLDEVCQLTGYARKHAVELLKHPPPDEPLVKRTRHRSATHGPANVGLLQLCWLVTRRNLWQTPALPRSIARRGRDRAGPLPSPECKLISTQDTGRVNQWRYQSAHQQRHPTRRRSQPSARRPRATLAAFSHDGSWAPRGNTGGGTLG
jgi:hypothetical protein